MLDASCCRAAAKACARAGRAPRRWAALLLLGLLALPGLAQATCSTMNVPDSFTTPSTNPMAAGTSITIDAGTRCDPFGLNPYPDNTNTTYPSHGTVSVDANAGIITYTNNGDGATSDSFVVDDASDHPFTVNVAIGPATSPITVSPAGLPNAPLGVAYSQTLSASGGTAPYTWSIASGALPPGLSLSGATIAGTPQSDGSFTVNITVQDSASVSTTKAYTITVPLATLTMSPASLPNPARGVPYSVTLSTSGGNAPYTYDVEPGYSLPAGLSLNPATGVISGTPTTTGNTTFELASTDSSVDIPYGTHYAVGKVYTVTVTAPPPLTLSPGSLPGATVGVAYSQTVSASGGAAPYSYAVTAGALPAGLSLNASTGVIAGTPTAGGTFNVTITATDSNSTGAVTGSQAYSVAVAAPTIAVAPATLPNATQGTAFSQTLTASGGTAPNTWAVTAGALPAGVTLSGAGVLAGTPTAAGSFSFTVTATDSSTGTGSPYTGTRSYTWNVVVSNPVISPTSLPAGAVAASYAQTISASGGTAPYTFAVTAGTLPAGLALTSAGALSGTPTVAGSFAFTVTTTDAAAKTGTQAYNLAIAAPTIALAPTMLPAPVLHVAYSQSVSASGGTAPYTYTIGAGTLPAGLTLNAATGAIGGTPTAAGPYSYTVQATDSSTGTGAPFSGTRSFSGTVSAPTIAISPGTLPAATVGSAVSQTLGASGGATPYSYAVTAGSLPAGVSLASNGTFSGTPTAGGNFNVTVTATDSNTNTGSQAYTWSVNAPSITLAPAMPAATDGETYAQSLSASGGTAPYTYTITSGSLPAGLSLDASTGTVFGRPTAVGNYSFTVQAKDSSTGTGPYTGTSNYFLTVDAPTLRLTPAAGNLSASYGQAYSQTFTAAAGMEPYGYSLTGTLPTGLSFDAATGTLSGTPTAAGSFSFTVTATDSSTGTGAPFSISQNYTVQVGAPSIVLAPTSLAGGAVGNPYSATVSASGGLGPYSYSVTGGALPTGVVLGSSGTLSGTPTAAGSFSVTVTATDAHSQTGLQAYTLSIAAPTLALSPGTLPAATAESAYSQSVTASGGTAPYTYAISAGSLPAGLTLNAATGALSGTPTAAGSSSFTVKATDSTGGTGPYSVAQAYTLTVNAPSIALSPSTLPSMQVAVAVNQQLSASGGNGSYSYAIASGALPPGLALATTGLLSGTPSTAGSYAFSVTATDGLGFTGTQAYTVAVGQPKPVAQNDTASTPANQAVTVKVTANDSGPISSVAVAQTSAHGTAAVNGLNVVYTPASNYYGSDRFTYTATGPGGTSAPATVTVTVTPLAVPTAAAQNATVLAGKSVSIHATAGATGGPYTAVAIVTAPTSGNATVSGQDIVYTADPDASGQVTFTYSLSNPFGSSTPATATVTVQPRPVAVSRSVTAIAGVAVQVNLTDGARGGPFTGATLVSLAPASAGSARIEQVDGGYRLDFTSTPSYGGTVTATYTLSNAYATSAPATITVTVTARPDPSKDAEVLGLLGAQVDATRRFAQGQIANFQQRLESLHGGAGSGSFRNGVSFSSNGMRDARQAMQYTPGASNPGAWNRRYLVQPRQDQLPAAPAAAQDDYAVWTGGAVNFGARDAGGGSSGFDFSTAGVSLGVDHRVSASFAFGGGVGYGHDDTDIGHQGSRSRADSYSAAAYASFSPGAATFIDALAGYQWLSFDARRYVTTDAGMVQGHRSGHQVFASLSAGYDYRHTAWHVSPYGRLDLASAKLSGYTERGDAIYALTYGDQTVKTTTASLGLRADYLIKRTYGTLAPQLRVEYQHDFQDAAQATMRYADLLAGPLYHAQVDRIARDHLLLGLGMMMQMDSGVSLRMEYQNLFGGSDQRNQSVLLGVEKQF